MSQKICRVLRVNDFLYILLLYVVEFVADELSYLHENFVLDLVFQKNFLVRIIINLFFVTTFRTHESGFLALISQILSKKSPDVPSILSVPKKQLLERLMESHLACKLNPDVFHLALFPTLENELNQDQQRLHALGV